MNTQPATQESTSTAIWLQSLSEGTAGITIKARHAVYTGASPLQKIEVFDTYRFGRILLLGGVIVLTERDEHIYHEMITHPALLMHPDPQRVCIIGGGDGGCAREVLRHSDVQEVTVIEIDKHVTDIITTYFPKLAESFSSDKISLRIEDGCAYLQSAGAAFDVIVVDSYDPGGPVQSLETASFYELVRARLTDNGIAVFQTDSPESRSSVLQTTVQRISPYFGGYRVYLCPMPSFPGGQCSFVVAAVHKSRLEHFDASRYRQTAHLCAYYNDAIHRGATALPQHIKQLVET
ncbi:MAG: polyamine aminopropyltransferase [Chitinivibrionales bacterium]|nr:polyamine aminopropyltransferase [Chitinivibrionales bacterium]